MDRLKHRLIDTVAFFGGGLHSRIKDQGAIYKGECSQVLKATPSEYVDLVVTSPPYGKIRDYNGFDFDYKPIARELYRVTKQGGAVAWNVADQIIGGGESLTSFRQALYFQSLGFRVHQTIFYQRKGVTFPDSNRYTRSAEFVFVFSKGKPKTFNPIVDRKNISRDAKKRHENERHMKTERQKNGKMKLKERKKVPLFSRRNNIWLIDGGYMKGTNDKFAHQHPALMPEALARDLIRSFSNPGDLVLDPMCGGGTTLKMARELKRDYVGIDVSANYCELSRRRVAMAKIPMPGFEGVL